VRESEKKKTADKESSDSEDIFERADDSQPEENY